ncbi:MAG: ABC transporter substrate-binding protein [Lachnospiraceae bacterium]|nr:ABC transporter substrate-binding protein [Lachnospiraceae bacterium]
MRKSTKKALSLLLVLAMVFAMAACGEDKTDVKPTSTPSNTGSETTTTKDDTSKNETTNTDQGTTDEPDKLVIETFEGDYVFKDSVSTLATNWNPHTYETSDDSYPADFIRSGLYTFIFNDELNPVEGKDPYTGYKIIPEMAASMPVDVTAKVRAAHPEFNIPADVESGYAYEIELNKLCTWEDGTAINADTYIYSLKKLLDPELKNYRASDYMDGDLEFANAKNYYYQGTINYMDNGVNNKLSKADLVKNADGTYSTEDGDPMYIGLDFALNWTGGDSLKDYVETYGTGYFDVTTWPELAALIDENGLVALTDESYALFLPVVTGNPAWGETEDDAFNYFVQKHEYVANYDFANVGIIKNDDYKITLVFGKSLAGFYLLYNLSGNWIVYQPYYDKCLTKLEGTDAWTSTYNTSVATTMSYGPYKMTDYQTDKSMRFERNTNWWGYTDNKHIYKDPEDGLIYPMYQTTAVDCQVVAEAATRKLMFLKGQLMGYGLQSDDFAEYRDSEYTYVTPDETIYFFIFNGYMDAIKSREAADDFDQTKFDLETITLTSFRQAVAVTYDKEALCTAVSPARSGGYGLIGNNYIYHPETGAKYRDTDQAKQALCDFYSVDVSKFKSLDDAVASITGYDEVAAKALYKKAFDEALAAGYITDNDGDGVSDQAIEIIYSSSATSAFIQKTLDYLNKKMNEVTAGTPFAGKISFKESAPLGNAWSTNLKNGLTDTVLGGWSGSALNPYSLTDLYTNPSKQYDAKWFDASSIKMEYDGVTMTLKQWSDALNGTEVVVDGKGYNYGDGHASVDKRLDILSKIEYNVLMTYDYIPMLQNAGMSLLSQQVYYVIEEYNVILGRGGITYMKYNYDEKAWADYIASQGGELSY